MYFNSRWRSSFYPHTQMLMKKTSACVCNRTSAQNAFMMPDRAVKKKFEFRIFVEFKIKIHIRILDVRRAALSAAHKMCLRCRCRCILMFFIASLKPLHAALLIQNITEKQDINAEKMMFTSKLNPSRSHRTHIYHIFYRDIYQRCTRVSHKRDTCLESM